ncbi:MAG: hypothetical protein ISR76_02435 [Planctomycetes bacterium]|nr:hypothetical protein [Planctomycetota bacterium]MBL7007827.1 hypothetical protein [Planctomycetota bacterium]
MSSDLLGLFLLLVVFSAALAVIVSGYRDDDPARILRGTVRRSLSFLGAVVAIGVVSLGVSWFLS